MQSGRRVKPKLLLALCIIAVVVGFYQLTLLRDYLHWKEIQCDPKHSVIFLKTHKTAGSTIQNILMRYAENNGLLITLPLSLNYFGHPEPFKHEMVPHLKLGYSYNILCHHARFNYKEMQKVVVGNATFVTILRDPAHLFESLYSYYKLKKYFNLSLEDFAYGTLPALTLSNKRIHGKIGRNQMMFDLGFNEKRFDDSDAVWKYVQYLDRKFHLVMIAERMMESLVLLRHLLCWQPEDVLTFKHNVRLPFNKLSLQPNIQDGLRQLNTADQILYDYFDQRLSQRIAEFGVERMKYEVQELEKKIQAWYDFCVEDEVESSSLSFKFRPFSNQVFGFKLRSDLSNSTCEKLAKAELPYTSEIRKKQRPYYSINFVNAEDEESESVKS